MSDANKPTADQAAKDQPKQLTAAEAAKRVKRIVVETVPDGKDESGAPQFKKITKRVGVSADEVIAHRDYGTHVVVVTHDGQKLSSAED